MIQERDIIYCSKCEQVTQRKYIKDRMESYCCNLSDGEERHAIKTAVINMCRNFIYEDYNCVLCLQDTKVSFIGNCGYKCCVNCIRKHITRVYKAGNISNIRESKSTCRSMDCEDSCIYDRIISGLILPSDLIVNNLEHINCMTLGCKNIIFADEVNSDNYYICDYCNTSYCTLCNKTYMIDHECVDMVLKLSIETYTNMCDDLETKLTQSRIILSTLKSLKYIEKS